MRGRALAAPMKRGASAVWHGDLKGGKGTMSVDSGAFKGIPYAFTTRFEGTPGTNPEELVAGALAGCYSMALANNLHGAGIKAESVDSRATLTFEKGAEGWTTSEIHLDVTIKAPGANAQAVQEQAEKTKTTCPISRLLKTKVSVTAKLA
jgi:lipoyl-dependent peroxiredoxin